MATKVQTARAQDDYDARVELMRRAFSEISRLCFERDYKPDREDWALLDDARLDNTRSVDELRDSLKRAYLQIKSKSAKSIRPTGMSDRISKQEVGVCARL